LLFSTGLTLIYFFSERRRLRVRERLSVEKGRGVKFSFISRGGERGRKGENRDGRGDFEGKEREKKEK